MAETTAIKTEIVDEGRTVRCSSIDQCPGRGTADIVVGRERVHIDHDCPPAAGQESSPLEGETPRSAIEAVLIYAPKRIQAIERDIFTAKRNRQKVADAQAVHEAKLLTRIADAKGEDGKARFSNEAARKAQMQTSLAVDGDYARMGKAIDEADAEIHRLESELRRTELDFRAALGLALGRAKLRLELIL